MPSTSIQSTQLGGWYTPHQFHIINLPCPCLSSHGSQHYQVKQSRALLGSNLTRDSLVRAHQDGEPQVRWWYAAAAPTLSFPRYRTIVPGMPKKTRSNTGSHMEPYPFRLQTAFGSRYSSPLLSIAQAVRTFLLASATAATFFPRRRTKSINQRLRGSVFFPATRIAAWAP